MPVIIRQHEVLVCDRCEKESPEYRSLCPDCGRLVCFDCIGDWYMTHDSDDDDWEKCTSDLGDKYEFAKAQCIECWGKMEAKEEAKEKAEAARREAAMTLEDRVLRLESKKR